mgnify:CR=1 FL=1
MNIQWYPGHMTKTRRMIAEQIKSGSKDAVYQIVGHADQQTGTAAGNKRVAENRAKSVYDFLVKCGVNPKQLTYEGKGNAANVYENNQNCLLYTSPSPRDCS